MAKAIYALQLTLETEDPQEFCHWPPSLEMVAAVLQYSTAAEALSEGLHAEARLELFIVRAQDFEVDCPVCAAGVLKHNCRLCEGEGRIPRAKLEDLLRAAGVVPQAQGYCEFCPNDGTDCIVCGRKTVISSPNEETNP